MATDDAGEGGTAGDAELSAVEAFDLVAHEVRLGIVRALAAERRRNWHWSGLPFAELRKAVGVRDAGNFSYHLDKLRGHFVVKDGEEYKLTYAGMELAGAVVAGTYTEHVDQRTETVDVPCPACAEPLTAEYDRGFLALTCETHGLVFGTNPPPGVTRDRPIEETVALASLDARRDVALVRAGACPHCWGPTSATLPAERPLDPETGDPRTDPAEVWAQFDCARCGMAFWLPAGACIVSEPAVVAFHHDHGIDIRERSYVELDFVAADAPVVESETPVRVRVDVALDGDELSVWMDDETEVVGTECAPRE